MSDLVGPHHLSNRIRMERLVYKGVFLVVEGGSDAKFCDIFCARVSFRIVAANGRDNVIGCMSILNADGFTGAIGLIDRDFDGCENVNVTMPNVVLTDTHDIETMMIESPALDRVLVERASSEKMAAFLDEQRLSIREVILDRARHLGALRLVSRRKALSLKFKGLLFSSFIDAETMDVDTRAMVVTVLNKSNRHDLNPDALVTDISEVHTHGYSPWQLCCGHDLVNILVCGLRKALGSHSGAKVDADSVETDLRLAYKVEYFRGSGLWSTLLAWQNAHPGWEFLNDDCVTQSQPVAATAGHSD